MRKVTLFYILMIIVVILPAVIFNYGCRPGLFRSEITPCDGGAVIYPKTNTLVRPETSSNINIASGFEMSIPAGGVAGPSNIAVSAGPPPFASNGIISYQGDIFTVGSANLIKSAAVSLKIPDGYSGDFSGDKGLLRVLHYFSRGGIIGFTVPEIINGRAVVYLKNSHAAGGTVIRSAPLFAGAAWPAEIIYEAGESDDAELLVCLISIKTVKQFKTAGFNIYTDNPAISDNELSAAAAELDNAAAFARAGGIRTPSASAGKIDVYIMRFVGPTGGPANEVFSLSRRGEAFSRARAVFLSSNPYDWNRAKLYRQASQGYFYICQNEYSGMNDNTAGLSNAGWSWFIDASAAWFAAVMSEDPMSADGLNDSRATESLVSDSGGLFTRAGGGRERWYFLWWLSNKYGVSKIADMLNDASKLKPFADSAAALLSAEDFDGYFDSLMARSYGKIFEKAPLVGLPFTVKLRPLEAGIFRFDVSAGNDVNVVRAAGAGVKIYARVRAGININRAVSRNVIFRNPSLCEFISSGTADSNIFDKIYIASFNSEISQGAAEKEMASLTERSVQSGGGSYIYPAAAVFDKNVEKRSDITVITLAAAGDSLASIYNGAYRLVPDSDYAVFKNGVNIKAAYLDSIGPAGASLSFNFSGGKTLAFAVEIIDTTPFSKRPKPVSLSFEPELIILPHLSQYDLGGIKVNVRYNDATIKSPTAGVVWTVKQGSGVIDGNIYRPLDEDFEQLECEYAEEGFEPIYNYLSVSYSDRKLVPVLKTSFNTANAGETFTFDASGSVGSDMYEWWFDFANIYNSPDESARVKYWSGESKTSFVYTRGGVYQLVLKIKNTANPDYIKTAPASYISVKPLPPVISPPGGNYAREVGLAFSAGSETGRIIYTLDGSTPSAYANGIVYTAPFKINRTTLIKAIAVVEETEKTAMITSDIISANYIVSHNYDIIPSALQYDRSQTASVELAVRVEMNGDTLETIVYRDYTLSPGADYTMSGDTLVFSGGFLDSLPDGIASLIFNFGSGQSLVLTIDVFEKQVYNSTITPSQANFDKGIGRADIYITMMLNGNSPVSINYGDRELIKGSDYTLLEDRVTLKKEYLLTLPFGVSKLTFKFSAGDDAVLSLNVYQSYIIVEPVKTPEFSVPAGTYYETLSVAISSATPGATIKYTIDGSEPSQSNGVTYAGPLTISSDAVIKAMAFKAGYINSTTASCAYVLMLPAAAPEFVPGGGTYYYDQMVSIISATQGAAIKYTLDGTEPSTANGIAYSAPLVITVTTTVKAVAIKEGYTASAVTTAEYIMLPPPQPRVEAPVFTPAAGTYAAAQTVTLSCATAGATIKYTLDGTIPSSKNGTIYRNPIAVSSSTVIKAYAYLKSWADSEIVTAAYTILPPAADPVFAPAAGEYGPGLSVSITCATDGAAIKYTTDGTAPSATNGSEYTAPLVINATTTVKAIAIKAGIRDSQVVTAIYEILPPVSDPVFSPAAGTYIAPQTVTLSCATVGATIKYTLDGSEPSSKNGTTYKNPFTVSSGVTVKAMAYKNGLADSNVVSAAYEIIPPAADPAFAPAAGSYAPGVSVSITCATAGAAIIYTTDGTAPSATNGSEYASPLVINATTTVKAIAIKAGIRDSQVVTAIYEIMDPVAAPTFSPAAGSYSQAQKITLDTATGGATIIYTLDGTVPTRTNGTQYKKSFTISVSTTVKAFAYKSGKPDSEVVTAEYVITP